MRPPRSHEQHQFATHRLKRRAPRTQKVPAGMKTHLHSSQDRSLEPWAVTHAPWGSKFSVLPAKGSWHCSVTVHRIVRAIDLGATRSSGLPFPDGNDEHSPARHRRESKLRLVPLWDSSQDLLAAPEPEPSSSLVWSSCCLTAGVRVKCLS
jgi:hypothetical protein